MEGARVTAGSVDSIPGAGAVSIASRLVRVHEETPTVARVSTGVELTHSGTYTRGLIEVCAVTITLGLNGIPHAIYLGCARGLISLTVHTLYLTLGGVQYAHWVFRAGARRQHSAGILANGGGGIGVPHASIVAIAALLVRVLKSAFPDAAVNSVDLTLIPFEALCVGALLASHQTAVRGPVPSTRRAFITGVLRGDKMARLFAQA